MAAGASAPLPAPWARRSPLSLFPPSPPRSCTPSLPAALRLFSFPAGGVEIMSDSDSEEGPDRQLKLVVLGDGTTGKVSAGPAGSAPSPPGLPSQSSLRPSCWGASSPWRLPVCCAALVAVPGGVTRADRSLVTAAVHVPSACSPRGCAAGPWRRAGRAPRRSPAARQSRALRSGAARVRSVLRIETLWRGFRPLVAPKRLGQQTDLHGFNPVFLSRNKRSG